MIKRVFLAATALVAAAPAHATVLVTYEAPGQETTTAAGTFVTETFDAQAVSIDTSFVGATGTYTHVGVIGNDLYGGAGNTGNYAGTYLGLGGAYVGSAGSYTLDLTAPATYFGAYFSAIDAANTVAFYDGVTLVHTLSLGDAITALSGNTAYLGKPETGEDAGQYYAFANVFFSGGSRFDKVVFSQPGSGQGFESDNHTIGIFSAAVPEPASWAMMIAGFGLVGGALRQRRGTAVRFA